MPMIHQIVTADCLEWMKTRPDQSVDLVIGSPPYENARTYGELGFSLKGQEWVNCVMGRGKPASRGRVETGQF